MKTSPVVSDGPEDLRWSDLNPYLSITILESVGDAEAAFVALKAFLRKAAEKRGRAESVRIRAEAEADTADEVGEALGFDGLYGVTRELTRLPGWTVREAGVLDVANQLSLAVRRHRLVAVCGEVPSEAALAKWIRSGSAPFRFMPADVLSGTFRGDGRMLWTKGTHRRRATKADSKALSGLRLQEALDALDDNSYALSAAKVDFVPEDESAIFRDLVTVSAEKSRVSWKPTSQFTIFLQATGEVLERLEKALVAEGDPEPLFGELAVRERDLSKVRGACDIRVFEPEEEPGADEEWVERVELLRDALIEVRGDPGSAEAAVDVGENGEIAGTLVLKPVEGRGGFGLEVLFEDTPPNEPVARKIRDALLEGDLFTVYYESGHAFDGREIHRRNLIGKPFPRLVFEDFAGFAVTKEKPGDKDIHEKIGKDGDNSLFAWVLRKYGNGWLLCDDGAGEIADFLHLDDDGTLTAIHVKAASSASLDRRIAVTRFEQVVSQAEKNVRLLENDRLIKELGARRLETSAAWHDGVRVAAPEFVEQLRNRVATDKTNVVIVQPHLLKAAHDRAREAAQAGRRDRGASNLDLLDNLLHSTRRTIIALCDDLTVIGCA